MIIIFSMVTICSLEGQIVSIEFGLTYYASKTNPSLHPEIIGNRIGNDDYYYKFSYEHYLKHNFIISASYSKYPISTFFHFYKKNEGGSKGWQGTNVNLFNIGASYEFFSDGKFILQPKCWIRFAKINTIRHWLYL